MLNHKKENRADSVTRFDVNSLFEFSKVVNSDVSLQFILNHFILTAMGKLLCIRGIVFLKIEEQTFHTETVRGFILDEEKKNIVITQKLKSIIYINSIKKKNEKWVTILNKNEIQVLIPLIFKNDVLGALGITKLSRKKLTNEEETYIKSLSNIAAAAIAQKLSVDKLINVNRELDKQIHQATTLFDLGKEFSSILNRERVIKLFSLSLMGQIGVRQFAICLKEGNEMKIVSSRFHDSIDASVICNLSGFENPSLVSEIVATKKLKKELKEIGISAIIPMKMQDEVKGVLAVGERIAGIPYTQTDLEYIYSIGNLLLISLENSRLFQEAVEKQKIEDDLLIAREIQRGMLPKILPKYAGYDLDAANISSKHVGGDYYDVINLDDDNFIIAIADVSGKGTPASLLMANLQAMIRALVPLKLSLSELTKRVNDLICESTGNDRFITLFLASVDKKNKSLTYVNAGHNLPFVLRKDDKIMRLEKGGLLLGVMKSTTYEEGIVQLVAGDVLVLFTDGVSEAMNPDGIEFGEERLLEIIKSRKNESAETIKEQIISEVQKYSGDYQSDDITLLVLKVS
ncbi:MAG: PP2C family protein-serine/threonine phosphatase [Bacteroidota bacterium]|nr:PP2C family protein-serine/threonine phosphatase [Bacteroidota bacterium]